jgi:hypothetical protein
MLRTKPVRTALSHLRRADLEHSMGLKSLGSPISSVTAWGSQILPFPWGSF